MIEDVMKELAAARDAVTEANERTLARSRQLGETEAYMGAALGALLQGRTDRAIEILREGLSGSTVAARTLAGLIQDGKAVH